MKRSFNRLLWIVFAGFLMVGVGVNRLMAQEAPAAPAEEMAPADQPAAAEEAAPAEEGVPAAEVAQTEGSGTATAGAGAEAYAAECARCHGDDGQAATTMGERMSVPPFTIARFAELGDEGLHAAVVEHDRNPAEDLSPEQIQAVIEHIRTLTR